jgi:hypothetical protein
LAAGGAVGGAGGVLVLFRGAATPCGSLAGIGAAAIPGLLCVPLLRALLLVLFWAGRGGWRGLVD